MADGIQGVMRGFAGYCGTVGLAAVALVLLSVRAAAGATRVSIGTRLEASATGGDGVFVQP